MAPGNRITGTASTSTNSLVDPYAKSLSGNVDWKQPIFPYDLASGDPLKMDTQDSADGVPKSVVIDTGFDWGDDCKPQRPLPDSVIYEMHVKGFSIRNPMVPENCAAPTPAWPMKSSINYLQETRRHRGRVTAHSPLHR